MTLRLVYNSVKNQFIQADESFSIFVNSGDKGGQEARNMNMDMSTQSVWMPTFGGKHKYFQVWWMLFTEYVSVYGFGVSIRKTRDPDFTSG